MVKIHKPQHGDIIKILPRINKNGKIEWARPFDCVGLNHEQKSQMICDNSDKRYLKRISHQLFYTTKRLPVTTKYSFNILLNGEISILNVGKTLMQIITDNRDLLNLKSNKHLVIQLKDISGYTSFDKSYVCDSEWTIPVSDINSGKEWMMWIKNNQPDYDSWIESNNVFAKRAILESFLGRDVLSELIIDDRDKKLKQLDI